MGLRGRRTVSRTLILLGLMILVLGLLWPWIGRLGLGRLPGDIIIQRGNFTFYFPIVTGIVLSIALSIILWIINR